MPSRRPSDPHRPFVPPRLLEDATTPPPEPDQKEETPLPEPDQKEETSTIFYLTRMMAKGKCATYGVWATTDSRVVVKAYGLDQREHWEREKQAFERMGDNDVAARFYGSHEGDLPNGERALLLFEENVPQSLRGWMKVNKSKKLSVENTVRFVRGVEKMHRRKVFHRDMHVENIRLRSDGSVVLVDFGRARNRSDEEMRCDDLNSLTLQPLYAKLDMGVPSSKKKKAISEILNVWG